uniref:Uncharacterized protein n=1 Tax=Oryza brachyantha TaxID=4533 RepID=J3LA43_ORYBR
MLTRNTSSLQYIRHFRRCKSKDSYGRFLLCEIPGIFSELKCLCITQQYLPFDQTIFGHTSYPLTLENPLKIY